MRGRGRWIAQTYRCPFQTDRKRHSNDHTSLATLGRHPMLSEILSKSFDGGLAGSTNLLLEVCHDSAPAPVDCIHAISLNLCMA
jgi:hypothetical protein